MSVYQYTKKIQICVKAGNMTSAVQLFNSMKAEGVDPSAVTYNVMMSGFSKAGDADSVHRLFDEMLKAGIKPNKHNFVTAIRACAIDVDLRRAAHLFSSMQQKKALKPDTWVYGALLHVCAVAGQLPLAKKCFARMQKEGLSGDIVTYGSLIDAYAEATTRKNVDQHLKECRQLLENIKAEKIAHNQMLYNLLIKLSIRGEVMPAALDFVSEMETVGLQPSMNIYSMLLDGLTKIPTVSEEEAALRMNQILDEISKRQLEPCIKIFTPLLNLCCKLKDLKRAKEFFQRLKRAGLKPDAICYRAMIKCYERLGDPSKKEEYLKPCFDLMEEVEASGIRLDRKVFTLLINACANARDINRALQVWTIVQKRDMKGNVALFGAMIKAFLRVNDLQGAFQYLNQMELTGTKRNEIICHMFLQFFTSKKMKKQAEQFLEEMVTLNVRQDDAIRKKLMSLGLA